MKTYSAKRSAPERILLVDDNEMGLRVRQVVLEELGYEVVPFRCGVEALKHFCSQPFDLVITDYRMPLLDGIQLIARIREHTPAIPIVLISGLAETLGLNEANTGADIVVQKNCHELTSLTRAVTRLMARRQPRKPVRIQTTQAVRAAAAGR
jgi:CheY-like chemotaxis protein